MSLKTIIFFCLLAVALGFSLSEEQEEAAYAEPQWANVEPIRVIGLARKGRSLQGRVEGRFEADEHGKRANVDYVHPISKDLDV